MKTNYTLPQRLLDGLFSVLEPKSNMITQAIFDKLDTIDTFCGKRFQ